MNGEAISAECPYPSHYVDVLGSRMHYLEAGEGDPIVFLHGIPTSSYVWRNIIPHLSSLGRCIAPDLIGFGQSDKPDIAYSIDDHIKYIDTLIETLKLKRITFILHGWGSIIGFDYAMRHEKNCKGLIFYESYLRPSHGDDLSLPYQEQIYAFIEQFNVGEMLMNGAQFVDRALPQAMTRTLSAVEMTRYREPFAKEGAGKPLLQYLKDLPQDDNHTNKIIAHYSSQLKKSKLPKLMLYSLPGFISSIATVMWAKDNLPNLEMIEVGEALHYAQESDPVLMGETISVWLQGIEQFR